MFFLIPLGIAAVSSASVVGCTSAVAASVVKKSAVKLCLGKAISYLVSHKSRSSEKRLTYHNDKYQG
jgi:hypothetical protein